MAEEDPPSTRPVPVRRDLPVVGPPILGREARARTSPPPPPRIRRETPLATVAHGVLAVADEAGPEVVAFVANLSQRADRLVDPRTVVAAVRALAASLPCVSERDTLAEGEDALGLSQAERLTLTRTIALCAFALHAR